jgi:hypothetical protein
VLAVWGLGAFTFATNRKKFQNRVFALLTLVSGCYSLANYFVTGDDSHPLFWVQTTLFTGTWMTMLLVLFASSINGRVFKLSVELMLGLVAVMTSLAAYSGNYISSISWEGNGLTVSYGQYYSWFIIYNISFLILALVVGYLYLQVQIGLQRKYFV